MTKHRFVFDPPMAENSWDAFNHDFAALPPGMVPSFTSPNECEVLSEMAPFEIESCLRAMHDRHAQGQLRPAPGAR